MRNIRMTLAYDGSAYVGWQVQPNGLSIQEVITKAIQKLTGEAVNLLCSGRTDSGVHAIGQVASFQTQSTIPVEGFRKAIQTYLPPDIIIRELSETASDFHATFSAKKKRYRYVIHNTRTHNPFLRQYVWHYHAPLDASAMHEAGQQLLGRHDFRSFETHWPNKATSVRTIMEVTVRRASFFPFMCDVGPPLSMETVGGDFIWLDFVADGFLYNMVRTLVGTLIPVGRGRWNGTDIRNVMNALDREAAGDTAPAHGLYLVEVDYGEPGQAVAAVGD